MERYNFSEEMKKFIRGAERNFNFLNQHLEEEEIVHKDLSDWIDSNLDNVDLDGLTEREKYLFALGIFVGNVECER